MSGLRRVAAAEAQHALNCRTSDNLLKAEFEAQDRKSERYRRRMDREISSARQDLADIEARTPSPRSAVGKQMKDNTVDQDPDLLAAKTKKNMALSKKIANSLEVKRLQREASPCGTRNFPCSSSHCQAVSVSPRAVQDLQKAATVLKNTPHEAEVLKLLTTVQTAGSTGSSPRSPRHARSPRS